MTKKTLYQSTRLNIALILLEIGFSINRLGAEEFISVVGSWSGYASQAETAAEFAKQSSHRVDVVGQNNKRVFEWLAAGRIDVGMWSPMATLSLDEAIKTYFPVEGSRPEVFSIGQFSVHIVVHRTNPTQQLTCDQLRGVCNGSIERWSDLGIGSGKITLVGEPEHSKSREVIQREILGTDSQFTSEITSFPSYESVTKAVAKDKYAIGFFLFRQEPIKDVKTVAVAREEQGPFVLPTAENIFAQRYLLSEHLYLILPQNTKVIAREYCKFACGQEGGAISKKWYLFSEFERQEWLAQERLNAEKAGKGEYISITGLAGSEKISRDLTMKFVETSEVARPNYLRKLLTKVAVRDFQSSAVDLLVLAGEANSLRAEFKDGTKHQLLGNSALGIMAHSERKLTSLSLEELHQIASGEIKNWPEAEGEGPPIRGYSLNATHPVMLIYYEQLVRRKITEREGTGLLLNSRRDNQDVISSIVKDPTGIGLVDLSQLPPLDGSVVVVGIVNADGKVSQPLPGRLPLNYPLAKPLTLFVSPTAGDAAQKFASWLEENPCVEVLARYHMFPPDGIQNPETLELIANNDLAVEALEAEVELASAKVEFDKELSAAAELTSSTGLPPDAEFGANPVTTTQAASTGSEDGSKPIAVASAQPITESSVDTISPGIPDLARNQEGIDSIAGALDSDRSQASWSFVMMIASVPLLVAGLIAVGIRVQVLRMRRKQWAEDNPLKLVE